MVKTLVLLVVNILVLLQVISGVTVGDDDVVTDDDFSLTGGDNVGVIKRHNDGVTNCGLFHMIFPARFIVSLRPSFLPGPGLGALLSSYLGGALYKLIYR